jgi:hypothetical protein
MNRFDYGDFEHIVHCIVPSVFGFFSSDEHLTHALAFYSHIVDLARPFQAVMILQPFFNAAPTFRFAEYALGEFFKTFLFDYAITPDGNRTSLVPSHAVFLMDCFTRAVPLLPEAHLRILRQLKNKKWPTLYFADLVLVRWLWVVTRAWLRASPCCGEQKYLDRVLTSVACQKQAIRRLYRTFFQTQSVFSLPMMFRSIDTNYFVFYLCVNDLCLLARMLEEQQVIPCGLTLNDFLEVDVNYQYHWFCCQVFPRACEPPETPKYHLVFPPMEPRRDDFERLTACFEILMEESRKFKDLSMWADLLATNVTMLMTGDLDYLMAHPQIPVSRELRQLMMLSCFDEATFGGHYLEIVGYGKRWDALVAKYADGKELRRQIGGMEAVRRWILDGIRLVRSTGRIRFPRMFQMLMAAMMQFMKIAQRPEFGETLLCSILKALPGRAVVVPFVLFNGTVAHEADFMSEEERRVWIQMEKCLLTILKDDRELLQVIGQKQADLRTITEKQVRRVFRLGGL